MLIRRVSAVRRWLGVSGAADCNGEQRQAARECLKHGVVLKDDKAKCSDLHRVFIKVVLFRQRTCVDSRRSADARRGALSLNQPALLNFRSLLTWPEHQTPSNSPRARCALRQMTANPSSSCTCISIRHPYKDERRDPEA